MPLNIGNPKTDEIDGIHKALKASLFLEFNSTRGINF
jgi:hypothetical protein